MQPKHLKAKNSPAFKKEPNIAPLSPPPTSPPKKKEKAKDTVTK